MGQPEKVGRYEVRGFLGSGAMGAVYRAWDPVISREVALKLLSRDSPLFLDAALRQRFRQEARAAGRLNHPAIVSVLDLGEDPAGDFIAMELVEGVSLEKVLESGPLDPARAAKVGLGLAEALAHAHSRGVVHRDIKPANLLVRPDGHVKVLDFGLAKLESGARTQTGVLMGTPFYMAPEYLTSGVVGPASDQFALGVVLFEALTGRRPFQGADFNAVMISVVRDPLPDLGRLCPAAPRALVELVSRTLEKDPSARFEGLTQVAEGLAKLGGGDGTRSYSVPDEQLLVQRLQADGLVDAAGAEALLGRLRNGERVVDAALELRLVKRAQLCRPVAAWLGVDALDPSRMPPLVPQVVGVDPALVDAHGLKLISPDYTRRQLGVIVAMERAVSVLPVIFAHLGGWTLRPVLATQDDLARLTPVQARPPSLTKPVSTARILWVGPDLELGRAAAALARAAGMKLTSTLTVEAAAALLSPQAFDRVLAVGMREDDEAQLLRHVTTYMPAATVSHVSPGSLLDGGAPGAGPQGHAPDWWRGLAEALRVPPAAAEGLTPHAELVRELAHKLGLSPTEATEAVELALTAATERLMAQAGQATRLVPSLGRALPSSALAALDGLLKSPRAGGRLDRSVQLVGAIELYLRTVDRGQDPARAAAALRGLEGRLAPRLLEEVLAVFGKPAAAPTRQILLVDPDEAGAGPLLLRLRSEGVAVKQVSDGEQALALVRAGGVALVLSEWAVPGRDGLALCLELQGRVPVLLWTTRSSPADMARALRIGALDVLGKDTPTELVVAKVMRHLPREERR